MVSLTRICVTSCNVSNTSSVHSVLCDQLRIYSLFNATPLNRRQLNHIGLDTCAFRRNGAIIIALDWAHPWQFIFTLREWLACIEQVLASEKVLENDLQSARAKREYAE